MREPRSPCLDISRSSSPLREIRRSPVICSLPSLIPYYCTLSGPFGLLLAHWTGESPILLSRRRCAPSSGRSERELRNHDVSNCLAAPSDHNGPQDLQATMEYVLVSTPYPTSRTPNLAGVDA